MESAVYTVAEVADLLRLSPVTVHRLTRAGAIPSVRLGRSRRIPRADFEQFLAGLPRTAWYGDTKMAGPTPHARARAQAGPATEMPRDPPARPIRKRARPGASKVTGGESPRNSTPSRHPVLLP